ncbi:MAG: phytanoyl-CoA dioxygenase family protein [Anaerolineae bacterium]|nr:phytanoyl-CoA dioxygenase family protein [Anaerolineae bacterium]
MDSIKPGSNGITLPSDLWFDQPDAHNHIDQQYQSKRISAEQAECLRTFVDDGYLVFSLDVHPHLFRALQNCVEQLWQDRPEDVAYAYFSPPLPMSDSDPAQERKSRYRIHDLHSICEAAFHLYLNRTIFTYIELLFDQPAVAIQSLYFEYGSQQIPHRDPQVVPVKPASHLLAAWIALENIDPDCGPLLYVPGSHRIPYYELAPGQFFFNAAKMGEKEIEAGRAWDQAQCHAWGLTTQHFTPKQGQVLIWHHSLLHGGATINNDTLTRKSFVVHYSTKAHYHRRGITLARKDGQGGFTAGQALYTDQTIEFEGCCGFKSPLRFCSTGKEDCFH